VLYLPVTDGCPRTVSVLFREKPQALQETVQQLVNQGVARTYGGHIFFAGGTLLLTSCALLCLLVGRVASRGDERFSWEDPCRNIRIGVVGRILLVMWCQRAPSVIAFFHATTISLGSPVEASDCSGSYPGVGSFLNFHPLGAAQLQLGEHWDDDDDGDG
jgi:hypothetical protein